VRNSEHCNVKAGRPRLASVSEAKTSFTKSVPPPAQRLSPNPVRHVSTAVVATDGLAVAIQSRIANGVEEIVVRFGVHIRSNASDHHLKGSKNQLDKR
jgi:hypothetical protein